MKNSSTQIRIQGTDGKLLSDADTAALLRSFDHFAK